MSVGIGARSRFSRVLASIRLEHRVARVDSDSPFLVRLVWQESPHRFLDASLGDAHFVPAIGALKLGYDCHCRIRHEAVTDEGDYLDADRRSTTLELRSDGTDVIATSARRSRARRCSCARA